MSHTRTTKKDSKKAHTYETLNNRLLKFHEKLNTIYKALQNKSSKETAALAAEIKLTSSVIDKTISESQNSVSDFNAKINMLKTNLNKISIDDLKKIILQLETPVGHLNSLNNSLSAQINRLKSLVASHNQNPADISNIDLMELTTIKSDLDKTVETLQKSKSKTKDAELLNFSILYKIHSQGIEMHKELTESCQKASSNESKAEATLQNSLKNFSSFNANIETLNSAFQSLKQPLSVTTNSLLKTDGAKGKVSAGDQPVANQIKNSKK